MKKTRSSVRPGILIVLVSIGLIIMALFVLSLSLLASAVALKPAGSLTNSPQSAVQNQIQLPNTETATFTPIPPETPTAVPSPTSALWQPLPPISQENYRGLLTNGNRDTYKVALTFDLCESEGDLAGFDTRIISVLNETQTPATLFLGGLWMQDHLDATRELAGNPLFELGNHSWSHEDFSTITPDEMQQQVLLTQQKMFDLLGYQTNLFRLPYGTYNDEALNNINGNGLYIIQWDDVSGDPDPNINAASMTSWVLQQAQPGSIIIMHANGRGWHTAEALPAMIQSLRDRGFTLVTISELLNLPPYK